MSIVDYKRGPREVLKGIWNRILHNLAYFTFPYQVTVQLHSLSINKVLLCSTSRST